MQLERAETYQASRLAMDRARAARDRGVRWLLAHIEPNGTPAAAEVRNGWGRVPWALALSGEIEVGSAVVGWAESSQFDRDGNFAEGPARGDGSLPSYGLAHYAIGAWLLGEVGPALRTVAAIRAMQDPESGGLPLFGSARNRYHDLLTTAQAGLAGLVTGRMDIADDAYRWIANSISQQPELDEGRLYNLCSGDKLVTDFKPSLSYLALTDFSRPRQAYFYPGMTAVFLSAYSRSKGVGDAMALADRLLQLNVAGSDEHQFRDRDSVQICKFGWGAAAMLVAESEGPWLQHVVRMAHWFADWQEPDGSWAPSRFLTENPDAADKMIKTAEHVVEVNAILTALGRAGAGPAQG